MLEMHVLLSKKEVKDALQRIKYKIIIINQNTMKCDFNHFNFIVVVLSVPLGIIKFVNKRAYINTKI